MAEIGYGLTRAEVVNLATDYAVILHLREKGKELIGIVQGLVIILLVCSSLNGKNLKNNKKLS
jgi:hypothetical protein